MSRSSVASLEYWEAFFLRSEYLVAPTANNQNIPNVLFLYIVYSKNRSSCFIKTVFDGGSCWFIVCYFVLWYFKTRSPDLTFESDVKKTEFVRCCFLRNMHHVGGNVANSGDYGEHGWAFVCSIFSWKKGYWETKSHIHLGWLQPCQNPINYPWSFWWWYISWAEFCPLSTVVHQSG